MAHRSGALRLLTLAACACLAALAAPDAFARGGGGGGYGGGNGGGGGGGGDGDWTWLIWLLFRYPQVGVPVLLIVIVLGIVGGKKSKNVQATRLIVRGSDVARESRGAEVVAAMRATDPAFDPDAFLERVKVAFLKVQQGWCGHDTTAFRPFVSDGIHERFALQIDEQKALGIRDRMEGLAVSGVSFAQLVSQGAFDAITVRIEAIAADFRVRIPDGAYHSGSRSPESFVEYWSFLRKEDALTKPGASGLIEGTCPNCGVTVVGNWGAACTHCKSLLRSGEHDWVLAEITQAVEWREAKPYEEFSDFLDADDPGLSAQHLEDLASVLFWRKATAERTGDARLLRRIASPSFVRSFEEEMAAQTAAGRRRWWGECAVGGVETLGVLRRGERDEATVEVRWQGTEYRSDGKGTSVAGERGSIATTLYVLARRHGVLTRVEDAVSSAHCPGCGGPDLGGETGACEFCGLLRNDGSRDWVLDQVFGRGDPRVSALLAEFRAARAAAATAAAPAAAAGPALGEGAIAWMVKVASAEGAVEPRERAALASVAGKAGLRAGRLDELLAAAAQPDWQVPEPSGPVEAGLWIEGMADAALADGRVSPAEAALLENLGSRYGLVAFDVRQTVNRVRARRYQEAKAALSRRGVDTQGGEA